MLELKNLSKSYENLKAVNNLNLNIKKGIIFGFLGHNGAGKTTTINMITGILNNDEGFISLDGVDINKSPLEFKKQIGFVPDSKDMFLNLTGYEYLNFMSTVYQKDYKTETILNLIEEFEIKDKLDDKIANYSHGLKQKLFICGSLISEPKLWILDEPMSGLDPKSAFILKDMMKKHSKKGNLVFFSTHVLEVAEKICDEIGIIKKGQLILNDSMKNIKNKYQDNLSLENIFLELTKNE
ncbi:MAG: ABC transporter ATP-binding protein [Peptostreptococcaceae bacterium]|jgi:ABC-2 type transport system ATP-binding protein|nr:ABC transporter ATP-binding protein [Peptostreptococcaceae bacterium]